MTAAARGRLAVVGTGIRPGLQTTPEARAEIAGAGRVFLLVNDPLAEGLVRGLHPGAESLAGCYREGRPRTEAYAAMVERILAAVREGHEVCAVFYGHPGVFVRPGHEAVRRARAEGFAARMLPGVSALDCLFADLGVDPADAGCQSFEATEFLLRRPRFDPCCALVIWQVGGAGDRAFHAGGRYDAGRGLELLARRLAEHYPPDHEAAVYEAAELPVGGPAIRRLAVAELPRAPVSPRSTLYLPPLPPPPPDPEAAAWLGLAAAAGSEPRKQRRARASDQTKSSCR